MVLEAGLRVAVPHGVVQPGRALERQLPVECRLDAGGQPGRVGEQVGRHPAGAELQVDLAGGELVERGQPAVRRGPVGDRWLREDGDVVELVTQRVDHLDQPLGVVGEVLLVAQRELDRAERAVPRSG